MQTDQQKQSTSTQIKQLKFLKGRKNIRDLSLINSLIVSGPLEWIGIYNSQLNSIPLYADSRFIESNNPFKIGMSCQICKQKKQQIYLINSHKEYLCIMFNYNFQQQVGNFLFKTGALKILI